VGEIDAIGKELDTTGAALVVFLCGTGVRPEEAFGAEWRDVDLKRRVFMVRRAFAKGRLKDYAKTAGSRRAVPLRRRVVDALEALAARRRGILFAAPEGGRMDINNWRNRSWTPSLEAAGVTHRRIYDLRHTYATWSLTAGVDIFTLARRMGTSVKMIDRTYGHLVAGADAYERELLDAFDAAAKPLGRYLDAEAEEDAA
jgi:integrase